MFVFIGIAAAFVTGTFVGCKAFCFMLKEVEKERLRREEETSKMLERQIKNWDQTCRHYVATHQEKSRHTPETLLQECQEHFDDPDILWL